MLIKLESGHKIFSTANSFEELNGKENVNLTLTDFPIC
jgi:hypothetical protein